MIYNGDADNQDIVSLMNDFTNQDNVSFPLKQKTRFANMANKQIWSWIFDAYGGWIYDDVNNSTNFPMAQAQLNSGQKDYDLPTEQLTIIGFEVKNQNGDWRRLREITLEELRRFNAELEFFETNGDPQYYRLVGSSVILYPAPNYTQASSLRVLIDRGSISFASTDTNKSPGFYSEFHEAVAVGGSHIFSMIKGLEQRKLLREDWKEWSDRIKNHYSLRFKERVPAKLNVSDSVRNNI